MVLNMMFSSTFNMAINTLISRNKFDLAGFSVGIVSKKKILSKKKVKSNNIILAIPSSGIHSNGYSLVRSLLKKKKFQIN